MAAHDEQESLLKSFYANEKEPETKDPPAEEETKDTGMVAEGVPLLAPGRGNPPVGVAVGALSSTTAPPSPWSTSLFACLGNNDEFFSSDLEVCVLGSCAPCFLHASNVERLYPTTENTFTNHFLAYSGLLCLGNLIFGCNALAPCFSCTNRTDIRQRYNLMGTGECFAKSCGCGTCFAESENRECVETVGDFATHYLCHSCALCQEGREIRRRMPHPGFFRSFVSMNAPTEQAMSM